MLISSGNLCGFVQNISVVNTLILERHTFAKKRQVLYQIDALLVGHYETIAYKHLLLE